MNGPHKAEMSYEGEEVEEKMKRTIKPLNSKVKITQSFGCSLCIISDYTNILCCTRI
jgi:hypothetical protein